MIISIHRRVQPVERGCCMLGEGISGQPYRPCLVPHGPTAVISVDSFAATSSLLLGYSSSHFKDFNPDFVEDPKFQGFPRHVE